MLNDIRFTNLRRNELSSKAQRQLLLTAMNGKGPVPHIDRREDIQQRAAMMLRDVHYVIEAHFEITA